MEIIRKNLILIVITFTHILDSVLMIRLIFKSTFISDVFFCDYISILEVVTIILLDFCIYESPFLWTKHPTPLK